METGDLSPELHRGDYCFGEVDFKDQCLEHFLLQTHHAKTFTLFTIVSSLPSTLTVPLSLSVTRLTLAHSILNLISRGILWFIG